MSANTSLERWIPKQQDVPVPLKEVRRESEENLTTLLVRVESSSRSYSNSLTHDADLSDLWDYYEMQIRRGRMQRHRIPAAYCNKRCKRTTFAYPSSVICRHPKQTTFARCLIALQYRYCKECCVLIPKSIIKDLETIRENKKPLEQRKPPTPEGYPIKCPCCGAKTAHVSTLIRKTKMGQILFKGEGY